MTPRVASLKGVVNSVVGRLHLLLCSGQCFVWQSTLQYAAIPQRLHLCLVWAAQTMHTNRGSPVLSRCLSASVPPFFAAPVTGLSEHELSMFTGLLPRDACVWHGTSSRRAAAVRARPRSACPLRWGRTIFNEIPESPDRGVIAAIGTFETWAMKIRSGLSGDGCQNSNVPRSGTYSRCQKSKVQLQYEV